MTAHRLRFLFLAIAVLLAGALIFREARTGKPSDVAPKRDTRIPAPANTGPPVADVARERQGIEAAIRALPDYAPVVRRLEEYFAADWTAALDTFARRAALARSQDGPDAYVMETLRILRRNRGVMASRAEPNVLGSMFDAQIGMVDLLARSDPHLCVDFLFGQSDRALLDVYAHNRAQVAGLVDTSLSAMTDGMANPVAREPVTDDELQQLDDALSNQGLSRTEIDLLLDGRHPNPPIEDKRLCTIGQAYFATIAAMPEALRTRIQAMAAAAMGRE